MEASETDPLLSRRKPSVCSAYETSSDPPPFDDPPSKLLSEQNVELASSDDPALSTSAPDTSVFRLCDMASASSGVDPVPANSPDQSADRTASVQEAIEPTERLDDGDGPAVPTRDKTSPAAADLLRSAVDRRNPFHGGGYGSMMARTNAATSPDTGRTPDISAVNASTSPENSLNDDSQLSASRYQQEQLFALDNTTVLQACVFLEDAIKYRSIHHRVDKETLHLYRVYYSKPIQWLLFFVLFTIHILAFFEYPSSLTASSDLRYRGQRLEVPCGVTEAIEVVCLMVLTCDLVCKSYLKGRVEFLKSKWLLASSLVLLLSFVDWSVSVAMMCTEVVRFRRILRPFFLLQNSSLMKKTVNCLRKTVPHVVSVLLLLFLHLYFFTLLGILLFPKEMHKHHSKNGTAANSSQDAGEGDLYFPDFVESFINLLVLLTTANNPDVMMPAYSKHRLYAIFFIVYLVIGLYCFMNMLTAVVYNQFRGYFSNSIQASLFRRRLGIKAMFEVLLRRQVAFRYSSSFSTLSQGVPLHYLQQVISKAKIPQKYRPSIEKELKELPECLLNYHQVQNLFSVLDTDVSKRTRPEIPQKSSSKAKRIQYVIIHRYFNYVGCFVAAVNMLCITLELGLEYDHIRNSRNTYLGILNLLFVLYFCVEQSLKLWAMGWHHYTWATGNVIDGIITAMLLITQGLYVAFYGIPFWGHDVSSNRGLTLWDLVRIINILIMIRLLRMIISLIKAMSIVCGTLFDLVKNLRAFAGILVVIYYSYAMLGMELFQGAIKYSNETSVNDTVQCGTYRQLQYWANNFDDFAAALVVLWDVMVVNNWHVFLHAYKRDTSGWSQLYFIIWWLLSVVITLNLFTALILENFIMRWDRQLQMKSSRSGNIQDGGPETDDNLLLSHFTVHDMFRNDLREPTDEALTVELHQHPHFYTS